MEFNCKMLNVNKVFQRFHIINDIKNILLHNLSMMNQIQNERCLIEMDIKENSLFYLPAKRDELEMKLMEKDVDLNEIITRCMNDVELLIIEIQSANDNIDQPIDTDIIQLYQDTFSSFITGISNLESLFLPGKNQTQELLHKIKLLGRNLQKVIQFEIEIT